MGEYFHDGKRYRAARRPAIVMGPKKKKTRRGAQALFGVSWFLSRDCSRVFCFVSTLPAAAYFVARSLHRKIRALTAYRVENASFPLPKLCSGARMRDRRDRFRDLGSATRWTITRYDFALAQREAGEREVVKRPSSMQYARNDVGFGRLFGGRRRIDVFSAESPELSFASVSRRL